MISVVIPVLNESKTIGDVVSFARAQPGVSEVLVIDDGSIDETAAIARAAGAIVHTSTMMGKGVSMEEGARFAAQDIVVYLDGDLRNLSADLIPLLTAPITKGEAEFVKAKFSRAAGRVTTLTAKPLLHTFFPELAHFTQPLGGIVAARRALLRRLRFENDYGVDIGILIDVHQLGARTAEVNIGHIEHESQSLQALGDMAKQVLRTILDRAARYGRLHTQQVDEMAEIERATQAELDVLLPRLRQTEKLALFDMDGTLIDGRFVLALAEKTHVGDELAKLLDHPDMDAEQRTRAIGMLFKGVDRQTIIDTARTMPLVPGAVDAVVGLRRAGYRVGIVTDSYFMAAETVRRRVFADFSIAHLMRFRSGIATGELTLSPAMIHEAGCPEHRICKLNTIVHLCQRMGLTPADVVAVGDSANDICMLKAAGRSFSFQPKSDAVAAAAQHRLDTSLADLLPILARYKSIDVTPTITLGNIGDVDLAAPSA